MSSRKTGNRRKNKKIIFVVIGIIVAAVIAAALFRTVGKKSISADSSENGEMISAEQEESAGDESSEENSHSSETTENTSEESAAAPDATDAADQELEGRVTAPYEYWLSAAVLTGISIEYPAFESGEFYISAETELGDRESSPGVYVTFYIDGQEKCIYGAPLEAERSDAGTKDIFSDVIGFAGFDEVSVSGIPEDFSSVNIENMNELIEQLVTVELYEH